MVKSLFRPDTVMGPVQLKAGWIVYVPRNARHPRRLGLTDKGENGGKPKASGGWA